MAIRGYWNGTTVQQVSQIGKKQKRCQASRFGRERQIPSATERWELQMPSV
jgi:hypothetical protein